MDKNSPKTDFNPKKNFSWVTNKSAIILSDLHLLGLNIVVGAAGLLVGTVSLVVGTGPAEEINKENWNVYKLSKQSRIWREIKTCWFSQFSPLSVADPGFLKCREGNANPKEGVPIYYFGHLFQKVYEIKKNWTEKGVHVPGTPWILQCLWLEGVNRSHQKETFMFPRGFVLIQFGNHTVL